MARKEVKRIIEKFPDVDRDLIRERYPDIDVERVIQRMDEIHLGNTRPKNYFWNRSFEKQK
jgi:hypothetical protein